MPDDPGMKSRIDIKDVLFFVGLVLVSAGLFLWFGLGPALTATGGLLLLASIFEAA